MGAKLGNFELGGRGAHVCYSLPRWAATADSDRARDPGRGPSPPFLTSAAESDRARAPGPRARAWAPGRGAPGWVNYSIHGPPTHPH